MLISDVLLDLDAVEEPVLGGDLHGGGGGLDDLGPGEHGVDVVLELSELLTAFGRVGEVPDDLTGVLKALQNVECLNVIDEGLGVIDDLGTVGHAALKLDAVVVASEAVDETGSEVRDGIDGRKEHLGGLDRADGEGEEVGKISAGLEEKLVVPVSFKSGDVRLDLGLVEEVVLADVSDELLRVGEDGSPFLDGGKVVGHSLASVEGLRDLKGNEAEFKSGLHIVVPASLMDSADASLYLMVHEFATGEAGLNLREVVVSGHTEDETGDEVGNAGDLSV